MATIRWASFHNVVSEESWARYVEYLKDWADDHADPAYAGTNPMSYAEWLDNKEEDEE